ncbi:hydantoinase/oxoprolinase family protein [Rhizobium laguerreae]|uniref:hydantoinase/oxoprolinase family protein n=1 Tax=Rhizobium TaxID=379 RepID=UPI0016177254|nr:MULTISPECIES: hydantoinase/oxoprolinase family protein [Rhizobium]MBB3525877.1 N-methylhydantoinase A [Rhizobium sp. BK456]MBY2910886.1 hydantoinase/oxoprolinase family protein [Rhizobium leguminosarum]MBY3397109.1 hydantoinase/oxoprolinase family protein [Rhizobium laguerreae]MBY3417964.1 hydantoinase/oxoprolinase family protein [Rhizobium laguerreae]MBY3425138.1 hydantoinase/oxoprolinase family protein [Rhizobium laguerreae]
MTYRISVDTGGTFTDVVVSDPEGNLTIGKSLTTPDRAFEGVSNSIANAAEQLGKTLIQLLAETSLFIYGTTRATNAIVTRQGAKTAFLTTDGFPDVLVFKEGGKRNPHDFSVDFPEPYIPRRRTFEIDERMSSEGTVSRPLNEAHAVKVLLQLKEEGYEAIAVSLIWSVANPAHERRIGELIEQHLPGLPYTLSHQLIPIVREYRRASATSIDASLKPLMQQHLRRLNSDLREAGYEGDVLVSTSIGGCNQISDVISKPIQLAKSGPSMAPVASRAFSTIENCGGDIIVCDTGGTTFDVGLVRENQLVYSRDTWLGGEWTGHLLGISSVDIRSVGAGGGSIAWIDDGGLLRVGPHSAGSVPGPACYGRGGQKPTVSDAACVLGYFNPDYFLGGRMTLDNEAARKAVETVATSIGRSIEEAAYGILSLASEVMIKAIHDITIGQGINPRESVILAGGGAAGVNIMLIAKELGCNNVLLPKQASALSASGMHFANILTEESVTHFTTSANFDSAGLANTLQGLTEKLDAFYAGLTNLPPGTKHRIEYFVEARYASQVWEISTPVVDPDLSSDEARNALIESFHRTHERLFEMRDEGSSIEFISWKARLSVETGISQTAKEPVGYSESFSGPEMYRNCFFGSGNPARTRIHQGDNIKPGMIFHGPCIIEEPTTTVVVFPDMTARVTANGHYLLTF